MHKKKIAAVLSMLMLVNCMTVLAPEVHAASAQDSGAGAKTWSVTRLDTGTHANATAKKNLAVSTNTATFDDNNVVLNCATLADTHINDHGAVNSQKLASALSQEASFAGGASNLDALLVAGDMSDFGIPSQVQEAKSIVDNSGIDLSKTRFVLALGNHDYYNHQINGAAWNGGYLYRDVFGNNAYNGATDDEIKKGDYQTTVKGYHFIVVNCSQYDGGVSYAADDLSWLQTQLENAKNDDPGKPIFVISHPEIKNTNLGSNDGDFWAGSDLYNVLKNYPQVIYLCGHLHYPEKDERDIWQGPFTVCQVGSTSYASNHPTDDNNNQKFVDIKSGMETADCYSTSEGLALQIDKNNNVKLTRLDFANKKTIKSPWIIPAPTSDNSQLKYYTPEQEAAGNTAPVFSENATFKVLKQDSSGYQFSFTQAQDNDMVYCYEISLCDKATGKTIKTISTLSDFYKSANAGDMSPTLTKNVSLMDIAPFDVSNNDYIVKIKAFDFFGASSDPETFEVQGQGSNTPIPSNDDVLNVDYTSGSLNDHSGYNTPVSTVGNPQIVTDSSLNKKVLALDGNSYVNYTMTDTQLLAMSQHFTLESVFKMNKTADLVVIENTQSSGIGFETTDSGYCELWAHINGSYKRAGVQLQQGQYYDLTATYDGATINLYLDGKLVNTAAASGTVDQDDTVDMCVGGDPAPGHTSTASTLFNGDIAMARITTRAITADDVVSRYNTFFKGSMVQELQNEQAKAQKLLDKPGAASQDLYNQLKAQIQKADTMIKDPSLTQSEVDTYVSDTDKLVQQLQNQLSEHNHVAKQAQNTPVIDGKLNDSIWSDAFETYTDPSSGKSMQFKYVWDKNNLYIAGKFKDSSLYCTPSKVFAGDPNAGSDAQYCWDYDDIGLYISPQNSQGSYAGDDVQFIFTYQNDGKPALRVGGAGTSNQQANYKSGVYDAVKSACSDTSDGWDFEVAIPFSVLGVTNPLSSTFGVGIAQNDVDPVAKTNTTLTDGTATWNSFAGSDTLTFVPDYADSTTPGNPGGGQGKDPGAGGSGQSVSVPAPAGPTSVPAAAHKNSTANPDTGDEEPDARLLLLLAGAALTLTGGLICGKKHRLHKHNV